MNLLHARVALRVRSLPDALDLAAPLCQANRATIAPLAAATLIPAAALCLAVRWGAGWSWPTIWVLVALLTGVLEGPFTVAFGELLFQSPGEVPWRAVLRRFGAAWPTFLAAHALARLLLLLTLPTIVLVPIVAALLVFVPEAVLLERAGAVAALVRSRRFVRRHLGSCVLLVGARIGAYAAMILAFEVLGQAIVGYVLQLGQPWGDLASTGGSLFAVLGAFAAVPLAAAARFLKYVDLRTRKEGWDLQLRFMAIGAASTTPSTSSGGRAA